jgi:hypothetical protein
VNTLAGIQGDALLDAYAGGKWDNYMADEDEFYATRLYTEGAKSVLKIGVPMTPNFLTGYGPDADDIHPAHTGLPNAFFKNPYEVAK